MYKEGEREIRDEDLLPFCASIGDIKGEFDGSFAADGDRDLASCFGSIQTQ